MCATEINSENEIPTDYNWNSRSQGQQPFLVAFQEILKQCVGYILL